MGKENRYNRAKTGQVVITYTAGSAPTLTGAQTIANAATPTVTELLKLILELKAQVDKLTR